MNKYTIPNELNAFRLDKALSILATQSRAQIKKAIQNSGISVNNVIILDPAVMVKQNDVILFSPQKPKSPELEATNISLDIIYEDEDLIVINKSAGMTVHPGAGNHNDTLVNALLYHIKTLSDIGSNIRPGIVHRLDKDTSGLMVVAKTNLAHIELAQQIERRQMIRKYKALIWGVITPLSGIIHNNIGRSRSDRQKMTILKYGGKEAITNYKTLELFFNGAISLIECKLSTGRTHQIRVQFSNLKHSIVGDQTYGNNARKMNHSPTSLKEKLIDFKRQALHSWYLSFMHPVHKKIMEFAIDLPSDMQEIMR